MSTNTPDTPDTPDTPATPRNPGDTHERTEVLHPTERTEALPVGEPRAAPAGQAPHAPVGVMEPTQPPVVRGPYVAPVILGLVCLVIAAAAFAQEIADWTIDWGNVGPLGIVIAGVVLVLLGGLGLLSSRRRRR